MSRSSVASVGELPHGSVPIAAARAMRARSKLSNGTLFDPAVADGRSSLARRFKDICAAITSDLGGGDTLTEGQKQLIRRVAMLSVTCERMEAEGIAGKEIDLDVFGQLVDRLGRAFVRLGLKRVAKDISPSVADIVARHQGRRK